MTIIANRSNPVALIKKTKDRLLARTGLNDYDSDSKIRAITESLIDEHISLQNNLEGVVKQLQLSSAEGEFLKTLSENVGVSELSETFAEVTASELSLAFYVESGTFGAINSASNFTISTGQVVYSEPNNNEAGALVEYVITEDVLCEAGENIAYANARARIPGSVSNVGAAVLVKHNFSGYAQAANNSLKVINFYPILNGRDRENPEQLRFRATQNYNTLQQISDTKIRLAALQIPGIMDAKTVPGMFGIGTVGVVVLAADYESNPALINAMQNKLNQIKGPVGLLVAVPASRVSFNMDLKLKSSRKFSAQEKTQAKISIKRIVSDYLKNTQLSGVVDTHEILELIRTNFKGELSHIGSSKDFWKTVSFNRGFNNSLLVSKEWMVSNFYSLEQDEFAFLGELTLDIKDVLDV